MKYFNQLLFIALLFSSICYSQITNNNELFLVKTARFIHSQQYAFNTLKLNFPGQKAAIENVELAFNKNFGTAIETINTKTKNLLGNKYESFIENLNNELNKSSITDIKNRLHEPIESPVLEILLAYKYENNPVDEFLNNFVNIYSVNTNSTKIDLSIKVPVSWKELDGDSPNVLKKFRNEYGTGNVTITLSTKNLSKLVSFINNDNMSAKKEFQKTSFKNHKIVPVQNENIARINQYDRLNSKPNSIQKRHITEQLYLSENNILEIKCIVNSTTGSDLDLQYQRINPLYKSIVKSIRIIKQPEKSSLLTSVKKKL
ncbi:MAG: hypothetical protein L3J20_11345 [Flavobacteriaceae bacterium]|nr:hypothetical protein [Flavobacteriaceae bacterium]